MNPAALRDIDDAAVGWAVRIDADDLSSTEQSALDAWLAADPRHRGALLRAEAALTLMDPVTPAVAAAPVASTKPARWASRSAWPKAAVGAGLAAIAAVLVAAVVLAPGAQTYRTAVGEQRSVRLQDGSVAIVNTDSRIRVLYSDKTRRIEVQQGEAWFKVAKNAQRPFIVDAEGVHVRATGTAFSVRRKGEDVQVVVTEGAVQTWRNGAAGPRTSISAGQGTNIPMAASVIRVAPVNENAALAWRSGKLVLDGMTVGEAADELNRYSLGKIRVVDPAVRSQRMIGLFLISKPDEFVQAVEQVTGASVSHEGSDTVIGRKNPAS